MNQRAPAKIQAKLLRRLLRRASNTEWGQRFEFARIAQESDVVKAYQARVPIHTYDDIQPFVDQVRAGAEDLFWPGGIKHFAVSSGTASKGKVIPLSKDMLQLNRSFAVTLTLQYLMRSRSVKTLLGKHLTLPGTIEGDPNFPSTLIGEVSGLQTLFAPGVFRIFLQALPSSIAFAPDWDTKLRSVVDQTMNQDIRLVAMAPTWALVVFGLLIERYNEVNGTSVRTVGEVWPKLQLYISGGVALSSYRSILEEQIGLPNIDFLEVYGASEGFFSYQTDLSDPAMHLHLNNGVFYEFVPLEELTSENPRRLTIEHVKTGIRYAPILTTCSGLWSYVLGDVIRFTNTSPHKIVVAGRTSEMIDKYGEAVFGEDAREAINKTCDVTDSLVREYHVSAIPPNGTQTPTHEWLLEFSRIPHDCEAFIRSLDFALCDINRHYQTRREAKAFRPPEIVLVPEGTFNAWLKTSKGQIRSQTKVPRMSDQRNIADGILAHAGQDARRICVDEFM
ncbi:MAG: GH3 auxin-responsive promoter family protein [Bacteroidota bacterium]|nr:GH3 auxin-responsive promoter family protein [Bacteroidota bacterium]MXW13960.1 GH3 auxin-responsive promoter family protein [Rhodothermaceae bacterium]MDE2645618.1 GH3 auxin-responsive promoter family protein [Bacteroidota bacterium]MXW33509.1 GH3 auxin-responsive promoter family protein [Rhodothermaceae bacterium]MYC04974.1 GH3 auxin-responsive promoter family protein [Rhodothermaceae bacterium]